MKAGLQPRLLSVLAMALGVVAALKLSDVWFGFEGAAAQTDAISGSVKSTNAETSSDEKNASSGDAAAPTLPPGEVERRILEQLAERRAALEAREETLSAREAIIAAAEKRLGERIEQLQKERERLSALKAEQEADDVEKIEALISAYERMKAKDAAAIFDALDEDIMLSVASGMRTQALAGVLSEMQPEKARKLTILLAERGQAVPSAAAAE